MIARPELPDQVKGTVQIENYTNDNFSIFGYTLNKLLDDIILIEFQDTFEEEGGYVDRGGIAVPINAVQHMWRIGKVILSGPGCEHVKNGDFITFPNDKGLKTSYVTVNDDNGKTVIVKNGTFLNESRIFGICSPTNAE
jgi:hypothetical protein